MRYKFKKVLEKIEFILQKEFKVKYFEELPDIIENRTIYIVGIKNYPWLIAFNCPCGCNKLIQLNLLIDGEDTWAFKINKKGKINIYPSVWRKVGCKSHFFIRKSKVDWVKGNRYFFY
jgi:hypothetical protein